VYFSNQDKFKPAGTKHATGSMTWHHILFLINALYNITGSQASKKYA
jgi:hypothetical protein